LDVDAFLLSPLGELWQVLPLASLCCSITLPEPKTSGGRKGWVNVEGALALMFLKHYYQSSDAKVIETFNGSLHYQLFTGLVLSPGKQIKDETLLSSWRSKFGQYMNVELFQSILQYHWKSHLSNTHVNKQDATCIESYITYPTSIKLLWRATEWVKQRTKEICKATHQRQPRNKFKAQKRKQRVYQLLKKPSHKQRLKRKKALIYHLEVLLRQLENLGVEYLKPSHQERLEVIKAMFQQQKAHLNDPDSKIENRIVSLHKDYVRPIVRGKENKPVEFGSKLHIYQVDNLEFIEHTSFDAFNETTRFESTINHHEVHFGVVKQVAADKIYHTNKNRNICSQKDIYHNFTPKGKPPKDPIIDKQNRKMREILSVDRGTRLEGAFGNVKNHYLGKANKSRTKENEIIWNYFAIHAANASKIRKKAFQVSIQK
jgi:hypothetical protein